MALFYFSGLTPFSNQKPMYEAPGILLATPHTTHSLSGAWQDSGFAQIPNYIATEYS